MVGPMEVPGGDRVAVLRDPQGAVFAVHSKVAV
jgi:predicted enzyme related to lactoylglutathione lyase